MFLQKNTLVQKWSNHSDCIRLYFAKFEVIYYNSAKCRFCVILIFIFLPIIYIYVKNNFVTLQKCNTAAFQTFKPCQFRTIICLIKNLLNICGVVNFLIGHDLISVDHKIIVNNWIRQFHNIFIHSVLNFENADIFRIFLAKSFKKRHSKAFIFSQLRLYQWIQLVKISNHYKLFCQ